jgi:hypothetical protein
MWEAITDITAEIKRCEAAGATLAAITMAYVCIDTMAFLSMPAAQTSQTRNDFIAWVNAYRKPIRTNLISTRGRTCTLRGAACFTPSVPRRSCTEGIRI